MSSSTVRLYEALKTEYPNKVYLGQFDQSANLRSTDSVVMLEMISQTSSINKDIAKRDQITYKVHVVGILQKEVDQKANEIRDLIEPYNDEYIYLMKFDGIETIYEDNAETYRKVVNFTCFPNQAGTNIPTGWYEHFVRFYNTSEYEVLNELELNYWPLTWVYSYESGVHRFTASHNYGVNIDPANMFYEINNYYNPDYFITMEKTTSSLIVAKPNEAGNLDETIFLFRIPKGTLIP